MITTRRKRPGCFFALALLRAEKKWHSTSWCPVSAADQRQALRQHVSWQAICWQEQRAMTTAMANVLARALYSGNGYSRGFGKTKRKQTWKFRYFDQYFTQKRVSFSTDRINNNVLFYNHRFPLLDSGDELLGVGKKCYHQPIPSSRWQQGREVGEGAFAMFLEGTPQNS